MKSRKSIVSSFLIGIFCFVAIVQTNAQDGPINQQIARANFLKSLPNFQTAAKLMFGRDKSEKELSQYFNGLFAVKYGMKKVIALPEANTYLKEYIAKSDNSNLRREIIENFIWDARGRTPDKTEYEAYDAVLKLQKTNYAQELLNQSKYLKEIQSEKNQMTNRAFQSAFCRDAKPDELAGSTESLYVNKIDSLRTFLYSFLGKTELEKTVRAFWSKRFNQGLRSNQLISVIDVFKPRKSLCSEMSKHWDLSQIK